MIFGVFMCQIFLSIFDESYSYQKTYSLSSERWSDNNCNRTTKHFNCSSETTRQQYSKLPGRLSRDLCDKNSTCSPPLITCQPIAYCNISEQAFGIPRDCNLSENGVAYFEPYNLCTTIKCPLYKRIKDLPESRKVNLRIPSNNRSVITKKEYEEVTILPILYVSHAIDLVFPLEGKPPPQYSCFEIKKNNADAKCIKIYKLLKPHTLEMMEKNGVFNKTYIPKEYFEIVTTMSKEKRHGHWLELHSPSTESIFADKQARSRTMTLEKLRKYKSKRNKKRKQLLKPEIAEANSNISSKIANAAGKLQDRSFVQNTNSNNSTLLSKGIVKNEDLKDMEKIFVRSKENMDSRADNLSIEFLNENDTGESCRANNRITTEMSLTKGPLLKLDVDSVRPNKDGKVNVPDKAESKMHSAAIKTTNEKQTLIKNKSYDAEKLETKEKLPDKFRLNDKHNKLISFSNSTSFQLITEESTYFMSTKFSYGHELHVK